MAAFPASFASIFLFGETAVIAELFGRLSPIASMAQAIVFAVYIPPHEPGPGIAHLSISPNCLSVIEPFALCPTASNTLTISNSFFPKHPGKIVPPYTKTAGRFSRNIAITQPGIFLSHPPNATNASKPSHPTTVSIESAITSRETKEYFIPSVPIEIPSEIVIVLKITAFPPASSAPSAASLANTSICELHGVT